MTEATEPEITAGGLKFIRDEILKVMVASIADSKNETLAAVVALNAPTSLAAAQIGCAIVAALVERGAIDPARVVAWAEWMADNQPPLNAPEGAANTLRAFAKILGAMSAPRPAGPSARN